VARTARGAVAQMRRGARTIRACGAGTHGGGKPAGIDPEQCAEDLDGQRDLGIDRADTPPHVAAVAAPARDRAGLNSVHTV